jgi:hypothetical protein
MGDTTYLHNLAVAVRAVSKQASKNTWGADPPYTIAFYLPNIGTGATTASVTVQVEFTTRSGTDAALDTATNTSWIPLGGSFTVTLSAATKVAYATTNAPLVKVRTNVTAYTVATNGDDSGLYVDLVVGP